MHLTRSRDATPSSNCCRIATVTRTMKANLAETVAEELRLDSRIDDERIIVTCEHSAITLRGVVRTYAEKCRAALIAGEVRGVSRVTNELEVRLVIGSYRTNEGLERLSATIIQNHCALNDPLPRVSARDGWITMEGVVATAAQRRAAEESLREVSGVRGITNRIEVAARLNDAGEAAVFRETVQRRGPAVEKLRVEIAGATMTLHAAVASVAARDALIGLASCMRGIARVKDDVVVQPPEVAPIGKRS
jgi:osmotically-inducible protein OsmY